MAQPLDPAKTASFTLEAKGDGRAAVLLLHGFTGSPWEVRPLGESLSERGYHVHAPQLPGHGQTPEAMLWVTWREWLVSAEAGLAQLAGFEHVVVGGLSMGALLGLLLAARHPSLVRGLVLLAPVMGLQGPQPRLLRALRRVPTEGLLPQWVKKESTDIELADVRAQSPILPRYPLARVLDLFTVQDLAAAAVRDVRCPSLVVAARRDHVVDFDAVVGLHRRLPRSRLLVLQRGCHIIPRDTDRALAATEVAEFIEGLDVSKAKGG